MLLQSMQEAKAKKKLVLSDHLPGGEDYTNMTMEQLEHALLEVNEVRTRFSMLAMCCRRRSKPSKQSARSTRVSWRLARLASDVDLRLREAAPSPGAGLWTYTLGRSHMSI